MALKDLKSNLAKGVGKPTSSPEGNIPEKSIVDRLLNSKRGNIRGVKIDDNTPEVVKYIDLTANGKKS